MTDRRPAPPAIPHRSPRRSRGIIRWRTGLLLIAVAFVVASCRFLPPPWSHSSPDKSDAAPALHTDSPDLPAGWQEIRLDTLSFHNGVFKGALTAWATSSEVEAIAIRIIGPLENQTITMRGMPYPITRILTARLPATIRLQCGSYQQTWLMESRSRWLLFALIFLVGAAGLYLGYALIRAGLFRAPQLELGRADDLRTNREECFELRCSHWRRTEFAVIWNYAKGETEIHAYWGLREPINNSLPSGPSERPSVIPHRPPAFGWLRPDRCRTTTLLRFESVELSKPSVQTSVTISAYWPSGALPQKRILEEKETLTFLQQSPENVIHHQITELQTEIEQLKKQFSASRERVPQALSANAAERSVKPESPNWRMFAEALRSAAQRPTPGPPRSYTPEEKFLAALNEWWSGHDRSAEDLRYLMNEAGFRARVCRLANLEDQVRAQTLTGEYVFRESTSYLEWLVVPRDADEREIWIAPMEASFHSSPTGLDILLTLFESPGKRPQSVRFRTLLRACRLERFESSSRAEARYRVRQRGLIEFEDSDRMPSSEAPRPPLWEAVLRSIHPDAFTRSTSSAVPPELEQAAELLVRIIRSESEQCADAKIRGERSKS